MTKVFGVGLIGAGDYSAVYLALAPLFRNFEVRAIASRTPASAEARGKEFGVRVQLIDDGAGDSVVVGPTVDEVGEPTAVVVEVGPEVFVDTVFGALVVDVVASPVTTPLVVVTVRVLVVVVVATSE